MLSSIREYLKDIWFFHRAKHDLYAIFEAFEVDIQTTETWKALHGMYKHAGSMSVEEAAFKAVYSSRHVKRDRVWMYLQYIVSKGDIPQTLLLDALITYRTFVRIVDLFGMKKVGLLMTKDPDLWWSKYDRTDTGSAGSVC
jgi:hypothetical protein